ncbi:hypothetical protein [Nitrosospira multiformis]|uniref:hypothetical protein n=1 Tax=Nitrosospira multiformis TaxID=1231 RepID=UPI0015A6AD94|nr:hypothetical protein [Nitrosospira multiformis]
MQNFQFTKGDRAMERRILTSLPCLGIVDLVDLHLDQFAAVPGLKLVDRFQVDA